MWILTQTTCHNIAKNICLLTYVHTYLKQDTSHVIETSCVKHKRVYTFFKICIQHNRSQVCKMLLIKILYIRPFSGSKTITAYYILILFLSKNNFLKSLFEDVRIFLFKFSCSLKVFKAWKKKKKLAIFSVLSTFYVNSISFVSCSVSL